MSDADNSTEQLRYARLSFAELSAHLGISYDAARIKARRRWKIERGNAGKPVVIIPFAELPERDQRTASEPSTERSIERPVEQPNELVGFLQAELDNAKERVITAEAELAEIREELGNARVQAATAEARIEGRQAVIEELRRQLEYERRPWWSRIISIRP